MDSTRNTPEQAPVAPAERLPYEPPAIVSEEVFETLALGCGKLDPQSQRCSSLGIKS